MLLTPRVLDGLLGVLEIVKNSEYNNTEFTSKWRDNVGWNAFNHHFCILPGLCSLYRRCPTSTRKHLRDCNPWERTKARALSSKIQTTMKRTRMKVRKKEPCQRTDCFSDSWPENRITFELDQNIDINSKALLDMITDTVSVATANAARAPVTSKPTNPEKNISVAEAFESW